jgi:hypothetical protein
MRIGANDPKYAPEILDTLPLFRIRGAETGLARTMLAEHWALARFACAPLSARGSR